MKQHEDTYELNRLSTAIAKYTELENNGYFSAPTHEGYTAVIATSTEYTGNSYDTLNHIDAQNRIFEQEADVITRGIANRGGDAEKIVTPSINDFLTVIKDPLCSDIIVIGNGCYRTVFFDDQHLTWWNASLATDHLKTGSFAQRTCAHFNPKKLNVGVGTFIMRNQTQIYAPVGEMVVDENPDEELLAKQVYPKKPTQIADFIRLDEYQEPSDPPLDMRTLIQQNVARGISTFLYGMRQ
jgi:hypothetical protein